MHTGSGFSSSTSSFPFRYQSASAPYSCVMYLTLVQLTVLLNEMLFFSAIQRTNNKHFLPYTFNASDYLPCSFLLLNMFGICGKRMRMFTCRVSNFIMMSKSTWHGVQKCVIGVQCISNVSPFCWTFTRYCTNSENVGQRGFLGVDFFPDPLTQNFKS